MRHPALDVIHDEHQALAAMLRSMSLLVAQAHREGHAPDFGVLRAMLFYVDEYPERLHHPKESELLFPRVRERCPELAATLDRLDSDHGRGEAAIRALEHSLLAYVWPVYCTAALTLGAAAAIAGVPLRGLPARTHLFMFLVGLVPQCIGHTTYNWSLRWLPPGLVALIGLAEPVGASLLAYFILNEGLTVGKGLGGCLILFGIYLATARRAGK